MTSVPGRLAHLTRAPGHEVDALADGARAREQAARQRLVDDRDAGRAGHGAVELAAFEDPRAQRPEVSGGGAENRASVRRRAPAARGPWPANRTVGPLFSGELVATAASRIPGVARPASSRRSGKLRRRESRHIVIPLAPPAAPTRSAGSKPSGAWISRVKLRTNSAAPARSTTVMAICPTRRAVRVRRCRGDRPAVRPPWASITLRSIRRAKSSGASARSTVVTADTASDTRQRRARRA